MANASNNPPGGNEARTSRQQLLTSQPSFRVQALVGRHHNNNGNMDRDSMANLNDRSWLTSSFRSQNFNNALNASGAVGGGGAGTGTSSSFRVPRQKSSSRNLLHMSLSGSQTWHNSNNYNSLSLTNYNSNNNLNHEFDSSMANFSDMFGVAGNDSTSFAGGASTASFHSRWGQQSVKFRANHFVASIEDSLEAHYQVGALLGEGGFGEVYECLHLQSGERRAVKVIPKHPNDLENQKVITEFNIVKDLDHPNILKLYSLFENESHFCLVTDLYAGGELYDELEAYGNLSEDEAALLMNNVLSCLNYCHKKGLAHRDLKPENILLDDNKKLEDLKVIDFGLAAYGDSYSGLEGSTYYMSPQVIQGQYNCKCDVWSCGVILYVCLAGFAPFEGEEEEDVVQEILCGRVDFEDETWDHVSDDAMDFISYLLTYDEENRPTAEQALQHPWLQRIRQQHNTACAKRRESTRNSISNLQNFQANSKLKQCVCSLIASQLLKKKEKEEIDSVFRSLDHDCDGRLTRQDVAMSYKEFFGRSLTKEDLDSMFQQVNFSGSGAIEYSEFVVASLFEKNLISDFRLMAAFKIFDKENKGYISPDNLKEVLALDDEMEGYIVNVIVRQVDDDGDGKISFEEFKDMMFSNAVIPPKPPSNKARRRQQNTKQNSFRNKGRSNRSLGSNSLDSFSMASSAHFTIEEDIFEDQSSHDGVTRMGPAADVDFDSERVVDDDVDSGAVLDSDLMSMASNSSFRHVLLMFDTESNGHIKPKQRVAQRG